MYLEFAILCSNNSKDSYLSILIKSRKNFSIHMVNTAPVSKGWNEHLPLSYLLVINNYENSYLNIVIKLHDNFNINIMLIIPLPKGVK